MATWKIDPAHSEVGFWLRHLMVTKVRGQFTDFSATLAADGEDFTSAKVSAEVKLASVSTREAKRDGHLQSPDFFDVAKFPVMTFTSARIEKVSGEKYRMTGALNLHGVTKDVTFDVESLGRAKDPWGNQRWAFEASAVLNRKDFGLGWNQALETGGVLVGEEVHLELNTQFVAG